MFAQAMFNACVTGLVGGCILVMLYSFIQWLDTAYYTRKIKRGKRR